MPALFGAYEPRVADATGAAFAFQAASISCVDGIARMARVFQSFPDHPARQEPRIKKATAVAFTQVASPKPSKNQSLAVSPDLQVFDTCFTSCKLMIRCSVADLALPEDSFLSELGVEVVPVI